MTAPYLNISRDAFSPATVQLVRASEAWESIVLAVTEVTASFLELMRAIDVDELIRRIATEQLDVTEADIRRVDGTAVVTWNRRRIEVLGLPA